MEQYLNRNGNSNVAHYQIELDRILVQFRDGSVYSYSYRKAGQFHVDQMKILAKQGCGLNSYIMRHVRKLYD